MTTDAAAVPMRPPKRPTYAGGTRRGRRFDGTKKGNASEFDGVRFSSFPCYGGNEIQINVRVR